MDTTKHTNLTRLGAIILALALALTLPVMAMAETSATAADATGAATAQAGPNQGGAMGNRPAALDTSTLTDEQKTVYDNAVTLYQQIEADVLADLVASGTVTQADVDAYQALRTNEEALAALDQSSWTAEQYKAYYEATQQTGDARKAAMQALADAGQLTQAQADALAAQGEANLWRTLMQNQNTNSNIQTALRTLEQARQTLNQTLRDAGINGLAAEDQLGGLGRGGMGAMGGQQPNFGNGGPNNGGANNGGTNNGTANGTNDGGNTMNGPQGGQPGGPNR